MKLYYDDPLVAGYMSQEFGVKITGDKFGEQVICSGIDIPYGIIECTLLPPFHIRPDSLPVFEPQNGDLVTWDGGTTWVDEYFDLSKECTECHFFSNLYGVREEIIQRDGKPFFTPKEAK